MMMKSTVSTASLVLLLIQVCYGQEDNSGNILEGQLPKGANASIFVMDKRNPVDIFDLNGVPTKSTRHPVTTAPGRAVVVPHNELLEAISNLEGQVELLEKRVATLERDKGDKGVKASKNGLIPTTESRFESRFCGNLTGNRGAFYQLDSSYGTWSDNFFCRTFLLRMPTTTEQYSASAEFFNVIGPEGINSGYVGFAFNAKDDFNFDVIYLRLHRPNQCYQAGYVEGGSFHRAGPMSASCPRGPPAGRLWFHLKLVVHLSDSTVFLNGIKIIQFRHHFPTLDRVGAISVAGMKNIVKIRNFRISNISPLPFQFDSCSSHTRMSDDYFHLEARRASSWPGDGFCTALCLRPLNVSGSYDISVSLHISVHARSTDSGIVGVVFNVQDAVNYDFVYFRPQHNGACYTTGYVLDGKLQWSGAKVGRCPGEPIRSISWFTVNIHVTTNNVAMTLNGQHLVRTRPHFPNSGRGGVAVGNHERNQVSFKDFTISPSKPDDFTFTGCAPATRAIGSFYVLDGRHGSWPTSGFCRALSNQKLMSTSYAITAMLFNRGRWAGELSNHVGVLYNAGDESNFEFIYFRPHSKQHCYTHGLVLNGQIQWSTVKDGGCASGSPKAKTWFKVTVAVRPDAAWIELNDNHLLSIPIRLPVHQTGGIIAGNDNENVLAFKGFRLYAIKEHPFSFTSCGERTHQSNGSFVLAASPDDRDRGDGRRLCLALFKSDLKIKVEKPSDSYSIQAQLSNMDSWSGSDWGNIGLAFNAANENNYEFFLISIRPASSCVVFGLVLNGNVKYTTKENRTCESPSWDTSRPWQQIRAKITATSVSLFVNGVQVAGVTPNLETRANGGVLMENGLNNMAMFREFSLIRR